MTSDRRLRGDGGPLHAALQSVLDDFDAWWAAETKRLAEAERCSHREIAEVLGTSIERIKEVSRAADDGSVDPAETRQPRADPRPDAGDDPGALASASTFPARS